MFLAIDIGNTNINIGIFENDKLIQTNKLVSNINLPEEEYVSILKNTLQNYTIEDCIIGSVVDELSQKIKNACDKAFNIKSMLWCNLLNCGIKIALEKPLEVGADRIANGYCAKIKYSLPAIVIDIGSATTFDIISKDATFIGGLIMPGINMQLKSLNSNTSKLPALKAEEAEKAIGTCTKTAILSGVVRASACAIEGMIKQCETELGEQATIIATGGDCSLLSKYMTRNFDYIDPDITLYGFKYLYDLNKSCLCLE